jgi:PHD/YefM family antitoxin component YafN of YafNO toxin-antitoxin module
MITVPSTEFIKGFGRYNLLAQREAIAVTSHGRIVGYYVSAHEYEEYQRLKLRQRQVLAAEDFTDAELEEIANAKVPAEANALTPDARTLKGCVPYQGPVKTVEEMEDAIFVNNRADRKVGLAGKLSEEMLEQVIKSVPPAEATAFNHEDKE